MSFLVIVLFFIKNEIRPLEEFDYIFIKGGTFRNINISTAKSVYISICISNKELDKFFSIFGQGAEVYIKDIIEPIVVKGDYNVKQKIEEIYGRILKYGDDDGLLRRLFATEILTGILRKMHRKKKLDEIPDAFINAMYEMSKLENLKAGVSAMEKLTGYSRPQLCRLMKKYYDKTPIEYLTNLRMNFASNLIKYSDMDLESVSENVGYSSLSHFYKKYNDYFGRSPTDARNKDGIRIR